MDITFEDVAHVIQDARYQQALVNDNPQPDKKIKLPKKNFDVEKFISDERIDIKKMVQEPLGRWFMEKYADVTVVSPDKVVRNPNGKMHQILNFVEEVAIIRRRDPESLIGIEDLVILLQKYGLQNMFNDAVAGKMDIDFDTILQEFEQLKLKDFETESVDSKLSLLEEVDREPSSFDGSVVEEGTDNLGSVRESRIKSGVGKARMTTAQTTTMRESVVQTQKPYNVAGTYGEASTDAYFENVDEERAGLDQAVRTRFHSKRTKAINDLLDVKIEQLCLPLFQELLQDKRVLHEYCKFKWYSLRNVGDRHIHYHRMLGQGAFGTVHGCLIIHVGVMMAMKIMAKKKVKLKHAKGQVKAEREALQALAEHPSPYCIQLRYAYETSENFHLIIPLAIGGDLKFHLRGGKKFDLHRARIYCAEIAYGLGHIHDLGMIMRDLKPRNVLLDGTGHCKISDFGLVVPITGKPVTGRAGTEGYWSPEVINGKSYSIDCDWWSYGCCVFELIAGVNPFSTKHTKLKTRNDGTRSGKVRFPSDFPSQAKSLVTGLLNMNPAERLGCRGNGVAEVMKQNHPFWKPLDLRSVKNGEAPAPWKPEKGRIYAANQQEMVEIDEAGNLGANMRKVKLTAEDIPEFDYYVDMDSHQRDIIQVIPLNTDEPKLRSDKWDGTYKPSKRSDCCSIN